MVLTEEELKAMRIRNKPTNIRIVIELWDDLYRFYLDNHGCFDERGTLCDTCQEIYRITREKPPVEVKGVYDKYDHE